MRNEQSAVIAAINSGSSSLKFGLFSFKEPLSPFAKGKIANIGTAACVFEVEVNGRKKQISHRGAIRSPQEAATVLADWMQQDSGMSPVLLGHRVVHGGLRFFHPEKIEWALITELETLQSLAPLHLPPAIGIMKTFLERWPQLSQFACFDTAFHASMPFEARHYAIPRDYWGMGLIRYGFHGISCDYICHRLKEMVDQFETKKIIIAHLGAGASITAVRQGKSVDNTMGFTPAGGLVMNTRPGDLDPGLVCYLQKHFQLDADRLEDMFNNESGLKAVAGASYGMEQLLSMENENRHAREAILLYCYHIKKQIAAMAAAAGGMDILVFTGGIGENAPQIRDRVCDGLAFLGVKKNLTVRPGVQVFVVPTDEEWMIARYVKDMDGNTTDIKQIL